MPCHSFESISLKPNYQSLVQQSVSHFAAIFLSSEFFSLADKFQPLVLLIYLLLWKFFASQDSSPCPLTSLPFWHLFLLSSTPAHRVPGINMECHSIGQTLYHKSFLIRVLRNAQQSTCSSVLNPFCIFLEAVVLDWHCHSQTMCSLAKLFVKWVAGFPGSKTEYMFWTFSAFLKCQSVTPALTLMDDTGSYFIETNSWVS